MSTAHPFEYAAPGLVVFPNPSDELLTVRLPQGAALADYWLEIYDATGRFVYRAVFPKGAEQVNADLSHCPPGRYAVRLASAHYPARVVLKIGK